MSPDDRQKCEWGLTSVLGHVWARLSFSLRPRRTGKQSNLVVIHLLLDHPLVFCGPNLSLLVLQFPCSLQKLLPTWEGRAKPLHASSSLSPHPSAWAPTAGAPTPAQPCFFPVPCRNLLIAMRKFLVQPQALIPR